MTPFAATFDVWDALTFGGLLLFSILVGIVGDVLVRMGKANKGGRE